ncbi:MAG: hypothetical protein QOH05_4281 [Acetobacteraceae bacterium]|jgi:hypothetical protein|nr:hypothetical protein [Acetobacteraceae bacterium]
MSNLTHLSDADLDSVGAGWGYNFTNIEIAKNFSVTNQSQTNVAVLSLAQQGGGQFSITKQVAIA